MRVALATLLLVASLAGRARAAEPEPAPCGSPKECFARLAASQRGIERMRADFRQTKRVALLSAPLVSTGTLEFRAPDSVRWQVVSPDPLVVEIDARGLRAGAPGAVGEIDAAEAAGPLRDLGAVFATGGASAGDRFAITAGSSGSSSFVLVPRDARLARVLEAVELELDPASGVARRVVLREPGGDRTEIEIDVREVVRGAPPAPPGTP